ncbi:MAG: HNH endonuclease [Hyphomicrobiales bacterium]|nr:HNH endonuclease [Hyphomicrobiales bacterium]
MPTRPPRPCSHPGCSTLTLSGRCGKHKAPKHNWKPDSVRGDRHKRGYGKEWDRIRKQVLIRDGELCQPCWKAGRVTRATQVDHVIPKTEGGTDELSNLQSICKACHGVKTQRESM